MDLKKYVHTSLDKFLTEQVSQNSNIWYHGSPNETLNYNIYSKGNQLPYGVHFTKNKDIAIDFANGLTKLKPTERGFLFSVLIDDDNLIDITLKNRYVKEGTQLYELFNEIGVKSKLTHIHTNVKDGVHYGIVEDDKEGYIKTIDTERVLNNSKPNIVKSVFYKYGKSPIIKYSMLSFTTSYPTMASCVYTDAICVLDKSYVEILSIEALTKDW